MTLPSQPSATGGTGRHPATSPLSPVQREFIKAISLLTGQDFEDCVVAALQQSLEGGCQRVTAISGGDGGIDGLSHNHQRAYCCYGLDTQPRPSTTSKALAGKVSEKFKEDILRILELGPRDEGLPRKDNDILEKVLDTSSPDKIKCIVLVTNAFYESSVIGTLKRAFIAFCKKSTMRFVDPKCDLMVWGPEDLARNIVITPQNLLRVQDPALFRVLTEFDTDTEAPPQDLHDAFYSKFECIIEANPSTSDIISEIRDDLRKLWQNGIALDNRLAANMPSIHEEFSRARRVSAREALIKSARHWQDPIDLLETCRAELQRTLASTSLGLAPSSILRELADAEVGRLIGECPLRWRKST